MMSYFDSFYENFLNKFNGNIQDWIKISVELLFILLVYFIFHRSLFWVTIIPVNAYYNEFIYLEFLKRVVSKPLLLVVVILFFGYFHKKLFISWSNFENNYSIRSFLTVLTCTLTWFYATYGINYYFNELHLFDRVLLVVLTLCVYWKPFFLIPYITLLLVIIGQFEHLPFFSLGTPPFLLIKILILFISFYVIRLITKNFKASVFIFMLGCIIATHYFTSGIFKFTINWLFNDQISFMFSSAYEKGWFSSLKAESISNITSVLSVFDMPLRLYTIIIECGMLLFFINIKWARFLIFGAVILHLGIFGYTGIFFWMWIVILILSYFVFRTKKLELNKIFNKKYFIISIFIIGGGWFWCQAKSLAWYDVPLYYSYKIYGETSKGERYRLGPNFFSHYDYQFTFGSIQFQKDEPRLSIFAGASDAKTFKYFNTDRTMDEVFEYERLEGKIQKDGVRQKQYEDFIIQYITNWNKKSMDLDFIKTIKAPPFYWTIPPSSIDDVRQQITSVIIIESTSFYSKKSGFKEIRTKEIERLAIPIVSFKHSLNYIKNDTGFSHHH